MPYLLAPAIVLLVTGVLANWILPGPKVRSSLQHLAAGIIFASVATEVVPEILSGSHVGSMVIGYVLGMILIFGIRSLEKKDSGKKSWLSLAIAGSVDLLIDGFLMGVAFSISKESGIVLTIAIAFEVLFLGFTFSVSFATRGVRQFHVLMLLSIMAAVLLAGGILGYWILGFLEPSLQVSAMAFGAVALLYLVAEELLVDAHEGGETVMGPLLLFIGFGGMILCAMVV